MADHAEALKSMLQDIINDRTEQATVTMHDYFVSKTREVTGLADAHTPVGDEPLEHNEPVDDDDMTNVDDDE